MTIRCTLFGHAPSIKAAPFKAKNIGCLARVGSEPVHCTRCDAPLLVDGEGLLHEVPALGTAGDRVPVDVERHQRLYADSQAA